VDFVAVVSEVSRAAEKLGPVAVDVILLGIEPAQAEEAWARGRELVQRFGAAVVFLVDGSEVEELSRMSGLGASAFLPRKATVRELFVVVDAAYRLRVLEKRLRTIELKMQEAQRLEGIGVMAGGIAHDFNNLLTSIFGAVEIGRHEAPVQSAVLPRLDQIERAASRAAELCQQLLAQAGRNSAGPRLLSLDAVVEETVRLAQSGLGEDISLQLGLAGNLKPVRAEEAPLRQIVVNLVANAAESIGAAAGFIRVVTFSRPLDHEALLQAQWAQEAAPGDYVVLEVADTGCGIEPEALPRLFDPLFTTKGPGRGLGLAAVARIVRKHRGAIGVESSLGRGAVFRIFLPVARESVSSPPLAAAGESPRGECAVAGGGAVLVVDDDEAVRALARWVVERAGFRVVTARDGDEAINVFRADPGAFRLVLLDLTMPRMSGAEALAGLRAIRPNVPVVVITGHREDALAEDEQVGVLGFLQKPFSPDTLRGVLHRHLGAKRS
jgi:signal transduction histidine kinase/CheY-like chemotaxis protein